MAIDFSHRGAGIKLVRMNRKSLRVLFAAGLLATLPVGAALACNGARGCSGVKTCTGSKAKHGGNHSSNAKSGKHYSKSKGKKIGPDAIALKEKKAK